MATVQVQLLGPLRIQLAGEERSVAPDMRYQALAYLAYAGDWVSREDLAFLFWADSPPQAARHHLRQLLKRLRKLEWLAGLEADQHRLRWQVTTDLAAFRQALEEGRWSDANPLYRGPLLTGMAGREESEFDTWLEVERRHLHSTWRDGLLEHAKECEAQGRSLAAAEFLATLLSHDDLDEEVVRAYMRQLAIAGHASRALQVYQVFSERLQRELDMTPTTVTEQLAEEIRQAERDSQKSMPTPTPQPQASSRSAARLPETVTSFVGRKSELAELVQLLTQPDCRLLTLTGLGGVGKSRIALRAAEELVQGYEDGVYFIPLEALSSAQAIPGLIAGVLGLDLEEQDESIGQLTRSIGEMRLLLVLDNYEHLLEGALVASELVRACPNLDLLITSRERLNLEEEWILPIAGLSYPQEASTPETAGDYDAVRLFSERAKRVRPRFELGEEDVANLLTICRLVDGFPLGIELAAVWTRFMSTSEIAQELSQSLDFLASSPRNLKERHQSIRAVFEYSWDLLSSHEQLVLRKLSIFFGGFRKEAAAVVAGSSIAVLAALVDKSLLRVSAGGRYDRHPLLYQYTQEKLAERSEEQGQAREKHGKYFLRFVQQRKEALLRVRHEDVLMEVEEELENIRVAWRWAVDTRQRKDLIETGFLLRSYCEARGRFQLADELFSYAVDGLSEASADDHLALGFLLLERAWIGFRLGSYQQALMDAERSLVLLRPLKEARGILHGLNTLGAVARRTGDYQGSRRYFLEGLELAKAKREVATAAVFLSNLGPLEQELGNPEQAGRYLQEALSLFRESGNRIQEVRAMMNLGSLAMSTGQPRRARALLEESLELAEELGLHQLIPHLMNNLANVLIDVGEFDRAAQLTKEALSWARQTGEKSVEISSLVNLGRVAFEQSDLTGADSSYRQALKLARSLREQSIVAGILLKLAVVRVSQEQSLAAAELVHRARQLAMKQGDEVVAEALLAELNKRLSADELAEAEKRGAEMAFEEFL
ncbi:MAG: tetratricopeptide repeat protein [Trueperaceae bacterium]|nr:MAG: tetratricopeptide repeat protein [Trueperaceae bacterium]